MATPIFEVKPGAYDSAGDPYEVLPDAAVMWGVFAWTDTFTYDWGAWCKRDTHPIGLEHCTWLADFATEADAHLFRQMKEDSWPKP